jgi:hypothetical protein
MADINCKICWGSRWMDDDCTTPCPECVQELPKPKRRKPQRRLPAQSAKRKEIEAVHAPFREQLKREVGYCDYCQEKREAGDLEEHHIGRNRWREIGNPRRTAIVCREPLKQCHKEMDDLSIDEQIAVVARAMKRAVRRVMK